LAAAGFARSEEKAVAAEAVRIGVYDSRAVAYAHFWTDVNQTKLKALFNEAKAAKESGDTKKYEELKKTLQEGQLAIHRQVFSTAPIDDVFEELKEQSPKIQKETGIAAFVSKWDVEKLKSYPKAKQIDVTDRLVQEFKPTEKQLKMIESIKKAKPISLEQADQCP
jgi:hypothetical protein